jgi:GNAT superfamily N-acetyltransferase
MLTLFLLNLSPFNLSPLKLKALTTIDAMLQHLDLIQELYPALSHEQYRTYLEAMVPNNYNQLAVFEDEQCIGLTGFWINTKLWSGKYIEIDNFIVSAKHRSKGIGKLITQYIEEKAIELNCSMIVLDAYTTNYAAHKFYYNQGFVAKGYHFVKILNAAGLT